MMDYICRDLMSLKTFSVSVRHDLHRIPEASGKEFKTAAYCQSVLCDAGLTIHTWPCCTGFIADLHVNDNYPLVAFRADMDALEMPDLTECDYTSEHPGLAHNCGHDSHMAILLTTARYLAASPECLKANVRFIFQMAEGGCGRIPGPSGVNLCIHTRTGSGPSNSITGTERKPPLLSWNWDILPQNS